MQGKARPSCVICAWRESCQKKFSIVNPAACPDFSLDVSIKDVPGNKGPNLIIQGGPGSGKSTLVERLITRLGNDVRVGGFFTREVRKNGERSGFKIVTVDKVEAMLAMAGGPGRHKVGRYSVFLENIETVAVPAIERALKECELVVIDEIGKMELYSKRFSELVEIALDSDCQVLATAPVDGTPFIERVTGRSDVRVLRIDSSNRDEILETAAGTIKGA